VAFLFTDTHCHLDFDAFDGDRDAVLDRARQAGVKRILNPGIDERSSRAAIVLSDQYEEVYVACGVHPNDALSWSEHSLDELRKMAGHPKVIAIGEIGLDYYRERAPHDLQKRVLLNQLALANEVNLPVVIHSRQAMHDILQLLADWHAELVKVNSPLADRPGVLHSYSGDQHEAKAAIDMNFFIGVTGPVTYQKADDLRQTLSKVPSSSLLLETDAPFLTPHPHRGERNESAYMRYTALKLAEIHHMTVEALAEKTTANSQKLFKW